MIILKYTIIFNKKEGEYLKWQGNLFGSAFGIARLIFREERSERVSEIVE